MRSLGSSTRVIYSFLFCNIDEFKFLKLSLHSGTRFCKMLFLNRQCSREGNLVYFVYPKPES